MNGTEKSKYSITFVHQIKLKFLTMMAPLDHSTTSHSPDVFDPYITIDESDKLIMFFERQTNTTKNQRFTFILNRGYMESSFGILMNST